jgi:hypothetical protein
MRITFLQLRCTFQSKKTRDFNENKTTYTSMGGTRYVNILETYLFISSPFGTTVVIFLKIKTNLKEKRMFRFVFIFKIMETYFFHCSFAVTF